MARLRIGDRIPGRIARVTGIRRERRGRDWFVVYELSDSVRGRPDPAASFAAITRRRR
jgi:hypothetical protein